MTDKNLMTLIDKLADAKAASDAAKKAYDALKNELVAEFQARGINDYDTGAHAVKISETASTRLDTTRIKIEFPEIYAEYGKTSVSIRVNIK